MSDIFNEKKAGSKNPLKPNEPFKWVFMEIIPATAPRHLTNKTTFSNDILIVDAYQPPPKLSGMEIITTEDVTDQLYLFQAIFGKVYEFGWWDLETISADSGTQFTST